MWRILWIRRLRTLHLIAVLAVVSLVILTLQYIDQILVRTPQHSNRDAINAAIFTSTLQSIVNLNINTVQSSVTPWPNSSDIFISVKTTSSNHVSRLSLLLRTWMQIVEAKQVHIVTDTGSDKWTQMANSMGMSTIISECRVSHSTSALCCKTGVEFEQYYAKRENYRWFCHFDDDTYVNIPALVKSLQQYNPERERLYLGHMPSKFAGIPERWKTLTEVKNSTLQRYFPEYKGNTTALYSFATGASYCLSSSLMEEVEIYTRGKQFSTTCSRIHHPDDVVLAAIITVLLGYNLTEVPLMQSHIESSSNRPSRSLKDYISLGYKFPNSISEITKMRRVKVAHAQFSIEEDPTGFLSYHCLLFPQTLWCSHLSEKNL